MKFNKNLLANFLFGCLGVLIIFIANGCYAAQLVGHHAIAKRFPVGVPTYSDVILSSRWPRGKGYRVTLNPATGKPYDTVVDAAKFHATRIDWVYTSDTAWINLIKSKGYRVGGTLNTILPDEVGGKTRLRGRIKNKKGELVTAPWMKVWNTIWWGCANSPEYKEIYLEHAKRMVAAGVDVIQMDDPRMNVHAIQWGGGFDKHCKVKAKNRGIDLSVSTELLSFQTESVDEFYGEMFRAIEKFAGRKIPFSANNFHGHWNWPMANFDYGMAELDDVSPNFFTKTMGDINRFGKLQVFTLRSRNPLMNRRAIALAYATGMHLLVPYDVYIKSTSKGSERYFGNPADYADLYGFVRAHPEYFDDFEDAAFFGPGLKDGRYLGSNPISVVGNNSTTYFFIRVAPNNPDGISIVHIVDVSNTKSPRSIRLDPFMFSKTGLVDIELLKPVPYDPYVHQNAEETAARALSKGEFWSHKQAPAFKALSESSMVQTVKNANHLIIDLPAIDLWAILVIKPDLSPKLKENNASSPQL